METHPGIKLTVKVVALTVVFALTLALLASLPGQPVSTVKAAGVLYAAADGILEGLCPITAPCTIQRAVSLASVGDTIYLESGTYTAPNEADTRVIWITKSLTLTGSCEFSGKGAVCSPANEPSIIYGELERRAISYSTYARTLTRVKSRSITFTSWAAMGKILQGVQQMTLIRPSAAVGVSLAYAMTY